MDAEQAAELVEQLQRLNTALEQSRQGFAQAFQGARTEARAAVDEATRGRDEFLDETVDLTESAAARVRRVIMRNFDGLGDKYKRELGQVGKIVDERALRGRDKAGGMLTGLQQLMSTVFRGVPFGGLFGVMLFGRQREQVALAQAQNAMQVLQQAGDYSRASVGAVGDEIRRVSQEVSNFNGFVTASNVALAGLGYTGADAGGRVDMSINGVSNTVRNMSIAMDMFFESGQGSSMKFAATIARDTNGALRESVELVRDIGMSVQGTGISYQSMLGSVMQVTSALRLQSNELSEAADAASLIQRAQAGFRMQGMSAQGAGTIAASGIQGVAQALNSMDIGLKAVLGQRLGGQEGLAAVQQFEEGFRGEVGSSFFEDAIREILGMSREIARGDPAAQYHVLKQLFGLNAEQAQTLLALQRSADRNVPLNEAISENSKQLQNAFRDEALKANLFERMINRLIEVVARFGSSLADLVGTGLEAVVAAIVYYSKSLTSTVTSDETSAFNALVNSVPDIMRDSLLQTRAAFDDALRLTGSAGRSTQSSAVDFRQKSRRFWREIDEGDPVAQPVELRAAERKAAATAFGMPATVGIELDIPAGSGKAVGKLHFPARPSREP